MNLFNLALATLHQRSRAGARVYKTCCRCRNLDKILKKEALLKTNFISFVPTKSSRLKNCLQPFFCGKIEALKSKMYVYKGIFHRKHRQLDVHKQIHWDADRKEMIMLEGMEVCPKAWRCVRRHVGGYGGVSELH